MNIRRRVLVPALLILVAVLVTGGALLLGSRPADVGSAAPLDSPTPTPPRIGADPGTDGTPVSIRDFVFETEQVKSPTAQKAQSKLWFAEGSWWAGLIEPSTERIKIFRLDWRTQTWLDTGTVVDERPTADPDYLAVGDLLYVASSGSRQSSTNAGRFLRFHYDTKAKRYVRDPDFPVQITPVGTNAIVIARDSTKRLWVTYVENGQVMVSHTDGNDARWSAPMALPGSGTLRSEDISSVIAFGPGRIGVMWSDQQRQQMLFAWHRDGDRDQVWSPVETVAEGAGSADNHLNLKAFQRDGKTLIAAAVKTSRDTVPDVNPLDPQILVMIRTDDGTWTGYEAGRIIDRHSRPIILIDETRRLLYVAAQSPFGGGSVYMKQTDLDHPAFPTGTGDLLLTSAKDTAIANASSTKGAISPSTGLVVMASDDGTGRFLHAAMDLGGTPIPTGVVDATRPERPKVVDAGPYLIVDDTFDAWDVGQDPGAGWTPTVTSGTVAVRKDGSAHVLRQTTSGPGGLAQSCRDIGRGGTDVTIDVRFLVRATGTGEVRPVSVRGAGGEIAGLRVAADGTVSYFDGTRRIKSARRLADGSWYDARVTVDSTKHRSAFRLRDAAGRTLISASGLHWRTPAAVEPRDVCFRATGGSAALDVDTLEVAR